MTPRATFFGWLLVVSFLSLQSSVISVSSSHARAHPSSFEDSTRHRAVPLPVRTQAGQRQLDTNRAVPLPVRTQAGQRKLEANRRAVPLPVRTQAGQRKLNMNRVVPLPVRTQAGQRHRELDDLDYVDILPLSLHRRLGQDKNPVPIMPPTKKVDDATVTPTMGRLDEPDGDEDATPSPSVLVVDPPMISDIEQPPTLRPSSRVVFPPVLNDNDSTTTAPAVNVVAMNETFPETIPTAPSPTKAPSTQSPKSQAPTSVAPMLFATTPAPSNVTTAPTMINLAPMVNITTEPTVASMVNITTEPTVALIVTATPTRVPAAAPALPPTENTTTTSVTPIVVQESNGGFMAGLLVGLGAFIGAAVAYLVLRHRATGTTDKVPSAPIAETPDTTAAVDDSTNPFNDLETPATFENHVSAPPDDAVDSDVVHPSKGDPSKAKVPSPFSVPNVTMAAAAAAAPTLNPHLLDYKHQSRSVTAVTAMPDLVQALPYEAGSGSTSRVWSSATPVASMWTPQDSDENDTTDDNAAVLLDARIVHLENASPRKAPRDAP